MAARGSAVLNDHNPAMYITGLFTINLFFIIVAYSLQYLGKYLMD